MTRRALSALALGAYRRALRARGLPSFAAALAGVVDELNLGEPDASARVDDAARRSQLAEMRLISPDDWERVRGSRARNQSPHGRIYASAWLWGELTGSDPLWAPMVPTWTRDPREGYCRFVARLTPRLADALRDLGQAQLGILGSQVARTNAAYSRAA